jgi:hypothetical protein
MDLVTAIGLAASSAQLANQAKGILCDLYKYFEAVKDAPKHSKELRQEVGFICELLDSLEDVLIARPVESRTIARLAAAFQDFRTMLDTMKKRASEKRTEGLRRLKWPFTKEENEKWLFKIERYKSVFNMALTLQNTLVLSRRSI